MTWWRVIVPADVTLRQRRFELLLWSFLLALAGYPLPLGFLAWFALARPLAIVAALPGRRAFAAGYFFGFFFNLFSLWWIARTTPPGMIAAVAIVGLYYAVVLWLFNRLYGYRRWLGVLLAPLLWVGMEYFRTITEFAFPWSDLGYTQAPYLYIIQFASLFSVHGLSLLIVTVNVLLWQVTRTAVSIERRLTAALASVAIVAALIAYGWVVVPRFPMPGTFPVAVLQGAVPLEIKWAEENENASLDRYDSLATAAGDSARLYVWPETAAPCYLTHEAGCRNRVADIVRRSGAPHLVGALAAERRNGRQRYFNSCFQFSADGRIDARYDKIKLVPFTEQVPYQDYLTFLRREYLTRYLTFIKTYNVRWWSDFYPGDSVVLFRVDEAEYGTLICFESAFPEFAREMVLRGAQFITAITNDTWFEGTPGVMTHARILRVRAIENRCWMVRAANTGYSYIVDAYGRIRTDLPLDRPGVLVGSVRLLDEFSLFTRIGDVVGRSSFLITLLALCILAGRWVARWLHRRFSG